MWNIVLDDALGLVCRECQWRGYGIRVPFLAPPPPSTRPMPTNGTLIRCMPMTSVGCKERF